VLRLIQAINKLLSYDIQYIKVPEYVIQLQESAKDIKQHLLDFFQPIRLAEYLVPEDEEIHDDLLAHYILHIYMGIMIIEYTQQTSLQINSTDSRLIESDEAGKSLQEELQRKNSRIEQLQAIIEEIKQTHLKEIQQKVSQLSEQDENNRKLSEELERTKKETAEKGEGLVKKGEELTKKGEVN
jgi:hypothetical protein